MPNDLDPDFGPDLSPNCFQRLPADDKIAAICLFTAASISKCCEKSIADLGLAAK